VAESPRSPIPATLLSGFLGAGKTTLLNRLLREPKGERIAAMVNDFGRLNIDAELIESTTADAIALTNGCICCSIREDLISAVRSLLTRAKPPDRIIVELSGVADPGAVLRTFQTMERSWPVDLDGVVAVADAEHFPDPTAPEYVLFRDQLAIADLIVLNKIDLVANDARATLAQRIRDWVPTARVAETVNAEIPLELVIGFRGAARAAPNVRLPDVHELGFDTWTWTSEHPLSLDALREVVTELPPQVFRAKGILHLSDRPDHRALLQVVGRRARLTRGAAWGEGEPRTSRLVCIGIGPVDARALTVALDGCRALSAGTSPIFAVYDWVRRRWTRQSGL
jgi:G3E family GTPase